MQILPRMRMCFLCIFHRNVLLAYRKIITLPDCVIFYEKRKEDEDPTGNVFLLEGMWKRKRNKCTRFTPAPSQQTTLILKQSNQFLAFDPFYWMWLDNGSQSDKYYSRENFSQWFRNDSHELLWLWRKFGALEWDSQKMFKLAVFFHISDSVSVHRIQN